ncbi:hypothetical protein QTN25_005651 [Entamoeba marina]
MVRSACNTLAHETNENTIVELFSGLNQKCSDKEKGESRKQKCLASIYYKHASSQFLRTFVTNSEATQKAAITSGIWKIVCSIIKQYYNDPEIAISLCGVIWGMADSGLQKELINVNIVDALNKALQVKDISTLIATVGALLTLAEEDDFVELLGSKETIQYIVKVIVIAQEDETLARLIGGFLCNACGEKNTQQQFMNNNGIEELMKLYKKFSGVPTVVSRILSGIRALTAEDEDVVKTFFKYVEEIIDVADKFPNDDVASALLAILFNFSQVEDMENEVHLKCTQAVQTRALISVETAQLALGYLMNLSTSDSVAEDFSNTTKIIETVQKAMSVYQNLPKIIIRSCGFIQNISDFEAGCEALQTYQITRNIISAFQTFKSDYDVLHSVLAAITNITQDDDLAVQVLVDGIGKHLDDILINYISNSSRTDDDDDLLRLSFICIINITASNGVDLYLPTTWGPHIIKAIQSTTNTTLCEKGIACLNGISLIGNVQNNLLDNGIVEVIVKHFQISQATTAKGLNTLFALSGLPEAPHFIIEANALPQAVQAVQISTTSAENFCGLLANCAKDKNVHTQLIKYAKNVIEIINSQLSEKAIMFGLNAIINLCSSEDTRVSLQSFELPKVISNAISSNKSIKTIVVAGWSALGNASIDSEIKKSLDSVGAFELCSEILTFYQNDEQVTEKIVNFLAAACNRSEDNKSVVNKKLGRVLEQLKDVISSERTKDIITRILKAIENK